MLYLSLLTRIRFIIDRIINTVFFLHKSEFCIVKGNNDYRYTSSFGEYERRQGDASCSWTYHRQLAQHRILLLYKHGIVSHTEHKDSITRHQPLIPVQRIPSRTPSLHQTSPLLSTLLWLRYFYNSMHRQRNILPQYTIPHCPIHFPSILILKSTIQKRRIQTIDDHIPDNKVKNRRPKLDDGAAYVGARDYVVFNGQRVGRLQDIDVAAV